MLDESLGDDLKQWQQFLAKLKEMREEVGLAAAPRKCTSTQSLVEFRLLDHPPWFWTPSLQSLLRKLADHMPSRV